MKILFTLFFLFTTGPLFANANDMLRYHATFSEQSDAVNYIQENKENLDLNQGLVDLIKYGCKFKLIKAITDVGADVTITFEKHRLEKSVFALAIEKKCGLDTIKMMVEKGVNVNDLLLFNALPLLNNLGEMHKEVTKFLFKELHDVLLQSDQNLIDRLLLKAVKSNNYFAARKLMQLGANPYYSPNLNSDRSAARIAINNKNHNMVAILFLIGNAEISHASLDLFSEILDGKLRLGEKYLIVLKEKVERLIGIKNGIIEEINSSAHHSSTITGRSQTGILEHELHKLGGRSKHKEDKLLSKINRLLSVE